MSREIKKFCNINDILEKLSTNVLFLEKLKKINLSQNLLKILKVVIILQKKFELIFLIMAAISKRNA